MFKFKRITDPYFEPPIFTDVLAEKLIRVMGIGKIRTLGENQLIILKRSDKALNLNEYFYPRDVNLDLGTISDKEKQELTNLIKLVL